MLLQWSIEYQRIWFFTFLPPPHIGPKTPGMRRLLSHFSPSFSPLFSSSCSQFKQTSAFPTPVPGLLFFMTYSMIGLNRSKLNIHYELLFFFFYKATWDRFASGLEIGMVPHTPGGVIWGLEKHQEMWPGGHMWRWGTFLLGGGQEEMGHTAFRVVRFTRYLEMTMTANRNPARAR